jgi:hypothetical protein
MLIVIPFWEKISLDRNTIWENLESVRNSIWYLGYSNLLGPTPKRASAPGWTRTNTEWILSPLPLPLGYRS